VKGQDDAEPKDCVMNIEDMSSEEIVRYLATKFDSMILSTAFMAKAGSVTVSTFLKGRECLPYVKDDVDKKVADFLKAPPVPPSPSSTKPKGGAQFRVIK
jgi:hypothetical protein